MTTARDDGPTLQQYVETRFNLLSERIDEKDKALRERITALETSTTGGFKHSEELHNIVQTNATRAVDKSEDQQRAINVAANEWRSTLNDFKTSLPSLGEFKQLRDDFGSYKIEQAQLVSAALKEKFKDTKEDNKAMWALVISIATAVLTLVVTLLKNHA